MANKVLIEGFQKKFGMSVSIKWQPIEIPNRDKQPRLQNPAKRLQPHLRPQHYTQNSPPPSGSPPGSPPSSAPPSNLPPTPSSTPPPGFSYSTVFCKAVPNPAAPQYHHPKSFSPTQGHLGYEASPVMLLGDLCEMRGVGQPFYELQFSHAGPDGFLYFFYEVHIPGIPYVFKGLIMVLPGLSPSAMLEEAQKAAAHEVLQRFPA